MSSKVIVALDFASAGEAMAFVDKVDPASCRLKVGFELYVAAGPALVEALVQRGFDVFLDLKFHDIPNTVASVCRVAAGLGVWMMNVHATGGLAMMQAAREAIEGAERRPYLIAVTVLTSMDREDLAGLGIDRSPAEQALFLAGLTQSAGLDGVVCSAQEAAAMRDRYGDAFLRVTPGIRPASAEAGDQKRVMTPTEAVRAGASHLVIGRPITRAEAPQAVLDGINRELDGLT
ncbi:MAG: orotidine-5'-phosphate decarboxylase [Gammaproteobacteria bacterium]|mgnify:FL=1|nr:orotidine-5'-phosphate decarboxylase [Gammaproteobacteria bacterium]MDX5374728.1 orotidine-5'-phosphate decarboxylase [Gammaproteobacteria bacterium]